MPCDKVKVIEDVSSESTENENPSTEKEHNMSFFIPSPSSSTRI